MPVENFSERDLQVLEYIENNPDATQSTLAEHIGVAVGTINFVVKRMVAKGHIRVKRLERKRLKYIITPQGISLRAKLALISVEYSMKLYRETRAEAKRLVNKLRSDGCKQVAIHGEGEIADVVRLTCLEQEMIVVTRPNVPIIEIKGSQILCSIPEEATIK